MIEAIVSLMFWRNSVHVHTYVRCIRNRGSSLFSMEQNIVGDVLFQVTQLNLILLM